MKHSSASLLLIASLAAFGAIAASSQTKVSTQVTVPPSSVSKSEDTGLRAHTNLKIVGTGPMTSAPQTAGPPFPGYLYETPASLACIYELVWPSPGCNPNVVTLNPNRGGGAIAIVDAYDDPNAYADLQAFSTQFGVQAITPKSFQVIYAPSGGATPGSCTGAATEPPSAAPTGWDVEESLDVQYAHAMAPKATLYLVEAQSNYYSDLFCAVSVASKLVASAGGGDVSMSWGGGEFSEETSYDPILTTHGVVYFASTGDDPGVIYPSASPNVVAAGGTSLSTNFNTGKFEFENSWQDGGGGASAYESRPHYQDEIARLVGSQRGVPDIASDANPATGVWVLDTLVYGPGSWYTVGGTSVSSPTLAGIVNAAGGFAHSTAAELETIYRSPFGFTDISVGNCGPYMGSWATPGWDFCTGVGSPRTYFGK
jgi:kumamolisin